MTGIIQSGRFSSAAGFNPVTDVTWSHSYWVEGTEFVALGYANNAAITSWPDETSTSDLTSEGSATYVTSRTALGSKPAVVTPGGATGRVKLGSAWTTIAVPYTIVIVAEGIGSGKLAASAHAGPYPWVFYNSTSWQCNAGATISGGTANTTKHLFVFINNGASSKIIVDGVTLVTGNPSSSSSTTMCLFGLVTTTSYNMVGSAAFAAIAPAVLDSTDLSDLLSWSQSQYGTP